jgi:hypothetical protein
MRFFFFYSLLFVAHSSHFYPSLNKIAIAVQGRADKLIQWMIMFNTVDHTKKSLLQDLNMHALLFLISNDKPLPVDKCNNIPGVSCLYAKDADWIEMRNKQAYAMYNFEMLHAIELKYWLFAEDDMMPMTCSAHRSEIQPQQTINCLSRFVRFLLTRSSYAVIMGSHTMGKENIVTDMFCGDQTFVAYHRHAVHIVLPYVEYSNKDKAVIDSQGVVNMLINRCLNGYSVSSGMLGFPSSKVKNETFHPEHTSPSRRYKAITTIYPNLNSEYLTYYKDSYREMCSKPKSLTYVDIERVNTSSSWRTTAAFHVCSKALRPQFHTFASNGHVVRVKD